MQSKHMNIYQDESGCLGFKEGSSKFYVVVLLCTQESKHIANVIRKFKGRIIKAGWPKGFEIKAAHLFQAKYNPKVPVEYKYKRSPEVPISDILTDLANCDIEIDAIVVFKEKIKNNLRTLPYGVLHNYYSGRILIERVVHYEQVNLYCDRTSKQTHTLRRFEGYIKVGALLTKGYNFPFNILYEDSNVVTGISATDFISWAVFRKFEFGDARFFDLIKHKIKNLKTFYFRQ